MKHFSFLAAIFLNCAIIFSSCQSSNMGPFFGTIAGAGIGASIGALLGGGEGAACGAGIGAVVGADLVDDFGNNN